MRRSTTTAVRALALLAAASLALTGCGREADAGGDGPGQGEAISDGPATGTIDVWAMGTEGEMLGDFVTAFQEEDPDAEVKVPAVQ